MATGLIAPIPSQWFNNSSQLLAGGLLNFYIAGTTTPLDTFSNVTLTVPNVNPYVLNAYGRWTNIFWTRGIGYKVVVVDALGGSIWQQDNLLVPADVTPVSPKDVPTGAIIDFGAASPPTGYLACNGAAVSRATYAALFAVISTIYGVGDGTTTFNLPDLRGLYRTMTPAAGTLAGKVGTALTNAENRAVGQHTHVLTDPGHAHYYNTLDSGGVGSDYPAGATAGSFKTLATASKVTGITLANTGAVVGTNAPYMQVTVMIKI